MCAYSIQFPRNLSIVVAKDFVEQSVAAGRAPSTLAHSLFLAQHLWDAGKRTPTNPSESDHTYTVNTRHGECTLDQSATGYFARKVLWLQLRKLSLTRRPDRDAIFAVNGHLELLAVPVRITCKSEWGKWGGPGGSPRDRGMLAGD